MAVSGASSLPAAAENQLNELKDLSGLRIPEQLPALLMEARPGLEESTFLLAPKRAKSQSLLGALSSMRLLSAQRADLDLLPIAAVDHSSLACVVCERQGEEPAPNVGEVVRWHLTDVPPGNQRAPLDTDAQLYLETIATEEATCEAGLQRMIETADKFEESHGERLPRPHECRPVRIASQNVIIGLAAYRHEAKFDGLAVEVWQTCQVPHVATHEGNRALAALTLAEAFRSGGTMEIRFEQHLEQAVPASLRQFARTHGIELGTDDPASIGPAQARELLFAVTPLPDELRARLQQRIDAGLLSAERACYVLLSGIWDPAELDFLLACSPRSGSILRGGVDPLDRAARRAELSLCRSAAMLGMLLRRLAQREEPITPASSDDNPEGGKNERRVEVVEDAARTISWQVLEDSGAVRFEGVAGGRLPWQPVSGALEIGPAQPLIVVARDLPSCAQWDLARELAREHDAVAATLEPHSAPRVKGARPKSVAQLVLPDRVSALDRAIETRLTASRVGRE